ncbi:MAG: asparagine synthase (glutamine-hydrolyzing) [Candidatus Deferrimicrobiaceae bacterium]
MCGIAGFVGRSGGGGGDEVLRRMAGRLRHRGPDAEGIFLEPDGSAGLAHCRLAVIDLSETGMQPMHGAAGDHVIAFNGEIYNFREIRADLEARGARFRGHSDTEVLLAAYREWGADCLRRFIGMFAFALWDRKGKSLLLARDRLGIKPLFYARKGDLLLFGSELKALLCHPALSPEIDDAALQYYLQFQYVPAPRCILKDCRKLLPGHVGILSEDGSWEEKSYWQAAPFYHEPASPDREEEAEEELDMLIRSSVRYRMISDVPLGAFLSGGIDSSLVVAMMQSLSSRPVKTFTIRFREEGYDEGEHAKRIAKHLGTDHHEKFCTREEALPLIRRLPDFYDEPFADSSAIPTMMVSDFCRQNVTVSLSGDGGDELFCGYPRYDWLRLAEKFAWLPAPLRRAASVFLRRLPFRDARRAGTVFRYDGAENVFLPMVGIVEKHRLPAIVPRVHDDSGLLFFDAFRDHGDLPAEKRAMLCDLLTYLPDDILTKVDRASMSVGLEARVPLLDHRIVEFAARLPLSWNFRGREQKRILKRVLYRYVPRTLMERPKMGFGVPLEVWFRGEWEAILREYLDAERIRRERFFLPSGVRELVEEHRSGRRNHFHRLWALVMFGMWRERYLPNSVGEAPRSS